MRVVSTQRMAMSLLLLWVAILLTALYAQADPPTTSRGASPSPRASPKGTKKPALLGPGGSGQNKNLSVRADRVVHTEHKTVARGHAVAISEGIYIEGDEIEVDHQTQMLVARKNVVLRLSGYELHAEIATYDIKTGLADLQDAYGVARNVTLYHNPIEDAMYFWATRIRWDGQVLRLIKATVTTCDLPGLKKHYKLTGNTINVYPNDRMEVRKARLYLKDKQILGRELVVFQLHQRRRQDFVPNLGYNSLDGLYVKDNLSFSLNPTTYGRAYVELYQKKGIGRGLDMTVGLSNRGTNNFSFYDLALPSRHAGRYRLNDILQYRLSPSMSALLQYEGDRYDSTDPRVFVPTSRLVEAAVNDAGPRHSFQFYDIVFNSGPAYSSSVSGLSYRQTLTNQISNGLSILYQRTTSSGIASSFVHALDRLSYRAPLFDTDVLLENTTVTGAPIFLVNRMPEVIVRSRLLNLGPVPLRLSLAAGRLEEAPSGARVGRADMQLAVPDTYFPAGEKGSILFGAGLRQMWYDTGDAQYEGAIRADWMQDLGRHWRTHVDYRFQRGNGFTPIQSDLFGQYNSLSAGLEYHDRDWLRLSVDGGRDFFYNRNYDVQGRLTVKPYTDMRLDLGATYDINTHQPLIFDSRVKIPLSPSVNVQHYALYDLVNRRLTYQDFMLQHESHDFLTSLVYRGVQKEVYLQVDIKTFPFTIPSVGPNDQQAVLTRTPIRGLRPSAIAPTNVPTPVR